MQIYSNLAQTPTHVHTFGEDIYIHKIAKPHSNTLHCVLYSFAYTIYIDVNIDSQKFTLCTYM